MSWPGRVEDAYGDEVESIKDMFTYEDCDECEQGLDNHTIAPGPLGHAHAWCKTGVPE